MNYYSSIKEELLNNEVYKRVKDYSKNKNELQTYYNVGKLLNEAGKYYGDKIIQEYSKRLMVDLNKKFSYTLLKNIRKYYMLFSDSKSPTMSDLLSLSHYVELLPLSDINKINYYIKMCLEHD